MFRLI